MIQTTEVSITYKGDGVQTLFSYPYPYRSSEDIVGYIVDESGHEERITTNFKYDNVTNMYQYPLAGDSLAAPNCLKLIRETPQQQNADLPGKLPFSLIEKSLDWIIMILQEIGSKCNNLWHVRNDCRLSETNARNSASAAAESETNAADSEEMAKKWAEYGTSPDGAADTDSPTGYTQSAKIWAALSKEYAGMSKFKLPIAYYNSVAEMKASETALAGRPCVTLGFATRTDGCGAKYIIREPNNTDVYDEYAIIKLDNGLVAELIEASQDYEDDVKIIFPLYGDADHPPVEETNGDCILIGRKNHWFMVDTYLCENNYAMIKRTFERYNIKTIDFVLITHYHTDHYMNLERLLSDTDIAVKKVILPRETSQADLKNDVASAKTKCITYCTGHSVPYEIADNQVLDFFGVELKIFNASADDYAYYENLNDKEYNDYSIGMLLSFRGHTALFTGDMQAAAKEKLMDDNIVTKPVDLFKASHHANGPLVLPFARRISPRAVAVTQTQRMSSISAGWGMISYYKNLGASVYIVGWQADDLVYSISMLGVSVVSNSILATNMHGDETCLIYVDASVPRGTFCDGSKEHPYNDVQDAFDNCNHYGNPHLKICIADGDYTGNQYKHNHEVRLQNARNINIYHDGDASKALLPPLTIIESKGIEIHGITTTTTVSGENNLRLNKSNVLVYSCIFSTTLAPKKAVSVHVNNNSSLRITETTIANMYKALYAVENSTIDVVGNMYGSGNSYSYSTQNGGKINIENNGFVDEVNRHYPYDDANPGIGEYIYSPVWKTEPTIFTMQGTKIPHIGEDNIHIDYYRSISSTNKKYKASYDNIIESSISEAPLYAGQIAIVNGVGYIATGKTTASWKQITN